MNLLFRVIYATHANGTHHKLALDALTKMQVERADDWQRLFLKHAELFMQGSKAPDKEFKDFRNHVLHPGDKYWGGAPEKAHAWYNHLVAALTAKNWTEAVWCAGVLSHYYTDPIQPFHTAQSEAESAIHRAAEWSISRSYNDLYAIGSERAHVLKLELPKGENWIKDFVCQGADTSHEDYERLIAHYDINKGASDPPAGLDDVARNLTADLLIYASTGFALILDRAINEAGVQPPQVDLTVDSVLATLKIPLKWVLKKIDDANERAAVQAMYDELMTTGRVEDNLSADDRMVRDLHEKEVLAPRREQRAKERRKRVSSSKPRTKSEPLSKLSSRGTDAPRTPQVPKTGAPSSHTPSTSFSRPPVTESVVTIKQVPKADRDTDDRDTNARPRIYLEGSDPIEAAPAIGPKTAKRLEAVNIITVDDLFQADAQQVAEKLDTRHITAATIHDWQDFAQLVMTVPGLRGTQAQLLVGSGYKTSHDIADADPSSLAADILRFATGKIGSRILRDGEPPDIEKIKSWVENAAQARAA